MEAAVLAYFRYMKYPDKITRHFIKSHPEIIFVYEDALKTNYEGQASECLGEPNTVGIPCCRCFLMDKESRDFEDAHFIDYAFYINEVVKRIPSDKPIYVLPDIGKTVCDMPPELYRYMIELLNSLENVINKKEF